MQEHERVVKQQWRWLGFLNQREQMIWGGVFLLISIVFALFTAYDQITERTGFEFLLTKQLDRHHQILAGTSIDPWQYRVFSTYTVEGAIRFARWLGVSYPELKAFAGVRVIQNLLIFLAAGVYWRTLGLKRMYVIVTLAFFTWGISYSGYGSGLAFDTYFDILFYLIAAYLIISRRFIWLIPLMVIAPLNRETSGLIPLMLLASILPIKSMREIDRRIAAIAGVCMIIFMIEYAFIRWIFGPRPTMEPFGQQLGVDLMVYNLTTARTYAFVFATVNIAPIVTLIYWRRVPAILRRFFWTIVPIWLAVHLFFGALVHGRLLLVPQAVIFLPAMFLVVQNEAKYANQSQS